MAGAGEVEGEAGEDALEAGSTGGLAGPLLLSKFLSIRKRPRKGVKV